MTNVNKVNFKKEWKLVLFIRMLEGKKFDWSLLYYFLFNFLFYFYLLCFIFINFIQILVIFSADHDYSTRVGGEFKHDEHGHFQFRKLAFNLKYVALFSHIEV